jgi:hypothetical protein
MMRTILAPEAMVTVLEDRDTSHLDANGKMELCVKEGTAYVTVEGDARDYIVKSGESMSVESRGLVVVQGFPNVAFKVCA